MDKKIMVVGDGEVTRVPNVPATELENISCPMALIVRDPNESYKDFSVRRAYINNIIKRFCKGMLFHDPSESGTYNVGRRIAKTEAKEAKRQRIKARKAERRKNGK